MDEAGWWIDEPTSDLKLKPRGSIARASFWLLGIPVPLVVLFYLLLRH
jgi:hypothetical protein